MIPTSGILYLHIIGPLDGPTNVATTSQQETAPAVAHNTTNNEYLVVYQYHTGSNHDIYGRLLSADGTPLGNAFPIANSSRHEQAPSIAYNSHANQYMVVFEHDYNGNGSNYRVEGQRVSATGTLFGSRLTIGGYIYHERRPHIAYNTTDNEYLTVFAYDNGSSEDVIIGQRLASNGSQIGSLFAATPFFTGHEDHAILSYNSVDNQYLVFADLDTNNDGHIDVVVGQRLEANGTLIGNYLGGAFNGSYPYLTYNTLLNQYILVYQNSSANIMLARYRANGSMNIWMSLTTSANDEQRPQIVYHEAANEYLATWEVDTNGDGSHYKLQGQRLASSISRVGDVFMVTTSTLDQLNHHLIYNHESHEYLTAYEYDESGNSQIQAQKVGGIAPPSPTPTATPTNTPIPPTPTPTNTHANRHTNQLPDDPYPVGDANQHT